eukprot:Pgem_evm1s11012
MFLFLPCVQYAEIKSHLGEEHSYWQNCYIAFVSHDGHSECEDHLIDFCCVCCSAIQQHSEMRFQEKRQLEMSMTQQVVTTQPDSFYDGDFVNDDTPLLQPPSYDDWPANNSHEKNPLLTV